MSQGFSSGDTTIIKFPVSPKKKKNYAIFHFSFHFA